MRTQKYRTEEQFISIMENAQNGNWKDAAKEAEQGGFYAQDLIHHYNNTVEMYDWSYEDLVYIAQMAQALR